MSEGPRPLRLSFVQGGLAGFGAVALAKWLVALFIQAEAAAAGDSLCLGKRLGTFRFVALQEEVGSKCQIPGKMRYYNFCKN